MNKLDPNCEDPVELWAEIWRLREELKGPDGFETWKDAAIAERLKLVEVRRELRKVMGGN